MYGFGGGVKADIGRFGSLDVLHFVYRGDLSDDDVSFLQSISGYGASTADVKRRYGATVRWDLGNFTAIGQFIGGRDGALDRTSWFAQPSYKISIPGWESFNQHGLVYRYSVLDVDLENAPADSLTWDRSQHVFGLISDLGEKLKLKTEYYLNDERSGGADVNNDEFLMQLEMKF